MNHYPVSKVSFFLLISFLEFTFFLVNFIVLCGVSVGEFANIWKFVVRDLIISFSVSSIGGGALSCLVDCGCVIQ